MQERFSKGSHAPCVHDRAGATDAYDYAYTLPSSRWQSRKDVCTHTWLIPNTMYAVFI